MDSADWHARFTHGWVFPDGAVLAASDEALGPITPVSHERDGKPVWHRRSPAVAVSGTMLCPRCQEPAWELTRHCVARHGDSDIQVFPPRPGAKRPEWMKPDWI